MASQQPQQTHRRLHVIAYLLFFFDYLESRTTITQIDTEHKIEHEYPIKYNTPL